MSDYLRFIKGELATNQHGRELPASIAAIHWCRHFDENAFTGKYEVITRDFNHESITSFVDEHGIQRDRFEFMEVWPGGYRLTLVFSDNEYWYVSGPAEVIRQVKEQIFRLDKKEKL